MTATTNGKPQRKQLSDQLDRLDGILDVLADALPQAVADACREGAREAVRQAVAELLTDPRVAALLRRATLAAEGPTRTLEMAPARVPPPNPFARLKAAARRAADRLAASVRPATTAVANAVRDAANAARTRLTGVVATVRVAGAVLSPVVQVRRVLRTAAVTGLTVAAVSFLLPHAWSAALGGACGGLVAGAAHLGLGVRRSFRAFRPA